MSSTHGDEHGLMHQIADPVFTHSLFVRLPNDSTLLFMSTISTPRHLGGLNKAQNTTLVAEVSTHVLALLNSGTITLTLNQAVDSMHETHHKQQLFVKDDVS